MCVLNLRWHNSEMMKRKNRKVEIVVVEKHLSKYLTENLRNEIVKG